MTAYAYSAPVVSARTMDAIRPLSNDERYAAWAQMYYGAGLHRSAITHMERAQADAQLRDNGRDGK